MLSPLIENHIGNVLTNSNYFLYSDLSSVLVPTRPALLLLIGWRVSHHPLPLHLLPVRLRIVQHVHQVVVDGAVLLLRGEEVIQVDGLQHWDRPHGKAGVVHLCCYSSCDQR